MARYKIFALHHCLQCAPLRSSCDNKREREKEKEGAEKDIRPDTPIVTQHYSNMSRFIKNGN